MKQLFFILFVFGVFSLGHLYVGFRLFLEETIGRTWKCRAWVAWIVLFVIELSGRLAYRGWTDGPHPLPIKLLSWASYLGMGIFVLLLLAVLLLDLEHVGVKLARRIAKLLGITSMQDLTQAGFEMTRWLANHEGLPEAEQQLHAQASDSLLSHAGEIEQRKETFNDFVRFVSSFLPVSETPSSDREQLSRTLHRIIACPTLEDASRLLHDTRSEDPNPES